ncbi:MAG: site-2 protease family protein [Planctomycetes bacterium]|nr:site-2 protease family protein [Planctomycetota bacterium]
MQTGQSRMNEDRHASTATSNGGAGPTDDALPLILSWADSEEQTWKIELQEEKIILRREDVVIELASGTWSRDIYVTAHGTGYIIRFDTADRSAGFFATTEQAQPLLTHLGRTKVSDSADARDETPVERPESLLWPKVSPLALWALATSALVFIPVLGWLAAPATTTLLVLHRNKVRPSRAYRHSRSLCTAAFVFLVVGLVVSVMATREWTRSVSQFPQMQTRPVQSTSLESIIAAHEGQRNFRRLALAVPDRQCEQPVPQRALATIGSGGSGETILAAAMGKREHNWGLIAAALIVVLLSLTVHEAAHAISAWWLGDDFARRLGRVTLNPLAHIDPIGTVLMPLILFLADAGVFGWARPVPVQLDHVPNPRRANMLIALAGPASNLLLASASLMLLIGLGCWLGLAAPGATVGNFATLNFTETVSATGFAWAPVFGPLCTVLKLGFIVNVFLAFFNLIPIPPLDGSWVLEHLFPRTLGAFYARIRPYSLLLFFGLIYSNALTYLLLPGITVLLLGFALVSLCTPF